MRAKKAKMAIYSLSASTISRAAGKSAVAAAAYRAGASLDDERQGLRHDFRRKGGVLHSEIITPKVAPIWAGDRNRLWNEVEKAEDKSTRRDTAKTGRDFRIALPHELSQAERVTVTREFSQFLVDRYGGAVDFAIHAPNGEGDERNFHAHVMMTTRALGADGFGAKIRVLDTSRTSSAEMLAIRQTWETIANAALAKGGHEARIDHRSNVAQGRDTQATIHMGVMATAMERNGELTELGDLNRDIKAANDARAKLKAEHAELTAQIIDLDAEREARASERLIAAAAKTHDPARILASLTERRATFSRAELNYHLRPFIEDVLARSAFMNDLLARPEIVPLRESADAMVSRYTTRAVLAEEAGLMASAGRMASATTHGMTAGQLADVLDLHLHLDGEQRRAVAHATAPNRLAIIAGEAGTGKTTTLAAIRDAYEAQGYEVKGLAWTNAVASSMKADGFAHSGTVASELMRLANGREHWNSKTVLVVDEAAMLATKHLAALMAKAEASGAKLILAGDRKQLASIERGGAFAALEDRHPPARLSKVYRVKSEDEKAAFNAMHRGDFRDALATFDKRGAIHWQKEPEAARAALVAKWADDSAREPDKSRFVFAYTNAEVHDLNRDLRAIRKARGELGEDHELTTKDGKKPFATGDRVQFTGSARDRDQRGAGLYNGATGTIKAIRAERVTVALDGAAGGKPREVSFKVGENAEAGEFNAIRHGYAGTIYKGQGKTLDQSYLLHSDNWRSAASYVALSRHRESVALFAAEKSAAWIMAEGGLAGLTDRQKASAERSYSAWAEAKPNLAARHDLSDYVGYVQGQWAEEKDLARLDRLARQFGRVEEARAASQFVQGEPTHTTDTPPKSAPLPPIFGRYDELRALAERVKERQGPNATPTAANAPATPAAAPARPMTASERLAATMKELAGDARPATDTEKPADRKPRERETGRDETYIRRKPPDRGRTR
jgi:Ti-type conjugative transfer relaxase TraA